MAPAVAPSIAAPASVWVEADTHLYRCGKDPMYGKDRNGRAMDEADARAAGARPASGRSCS